MTTDKLVTQKVGSTCLGDPCLVRSMLGLELGSISDSVLDFRFVITLNIITEYQVPAA